jgi:hypothetical protein
MTLAAAGAVALGAAPLGAVFESWRWIWYAWAAIAVVAGAHLLARSARLPGALVPVVGAAGLLLYLTAVFGADGALAGLIPTFDSVDLLRSGISNGLDDVNEYAAPVPPTTPLILLTAAALGLTAIVVDIVAVSLRRPAAAGLALLALYAVPTAVVLAGVPWILFAVAATGYLILLLVEGRDRLLHWGRPVDSPGAVPTARAAGDVDDAPSPLTGQRIGAVAIALAVLVPVLVPGMTGNTLNRLGARGGDGTGQGGGPLNEMASLRGQLQRGAPVEVMRVRVGLEKPPYLRMKVLDNYTRTGFTNYRMESSQFDVDGKGLDGLTAAPGGGRRYAAEIELTDAFTDDRLPTFYVADKVAGIGPGWSWDPERGVVQRNDQRGNFRYTIEGSVPEPSPAQLAQAPAGNPGGEYGTRTTRLPNDSVAPEVRRTIDAVTRGATSPYAQADAINDYFTDGTNGFTYTETTVGNDPDDLRNFLTSKQGYCEQYAAAMAVMLRQLGISSRVVLGYTLGREDPDDERVRVITTHDAHAWVEAYFEGYGWTWFDPTPLPGNRTSAPAYAPRPSASSGPSASASGGASASAGPTGNQLPQEDLDAASSGSGLDDDGLITPRRLLTAALVIAVVLLLLLPAVLRLTARRRRLRAAGGGDPGAAARAAWDEVVGTAADYGVPVPASETPRALARRLGRDLTLDDDAVRGLRLVALAEERARYAAHAGVSGDLAGAVRAVRHGLRGGASSRRRVRAALLPPSTLRAARRGGAARAATASAAATRLRESARRPLTPRRR